MDFLDRFQLHQRVTDITRPTSGTTIDHVISNTVTGDVYVLPFELSDHEAVIFSRKGKNHPSNFVKYERYVWGKNTTNYAKNFYPRCLDVDINNDETFHKSTSAFEMWVKGSVEESKVKGIKKINSAPWWNDKLSSLRSKVWKAKRERRFGKYKKQNRFS